METLADALPKEQARVRTVLGYYKEIGSAGAFAVATIEHSLKLADEAIMSGDLAKMIAAYKDLQTIEA